MSEILNKELPHVVDLEKSILSSMIQNPDRYLIEGRELGLMEAHFYKANHGKLYTVLNDLLTEGKPTELVYLSGTLRSIDMIENMGGVAEITDIATCETLHSNFRVYLDEVLKCYEKREAFYYGLQIQQKAMEGSHQDLLSLLSKDAESFQVLESEDNKPKTAKESFRDAFSEIEARMNNPLHALLPTPWEGMNKATGGGLAKGELHFFCGRPSAGKSVVACDLINHWASNRISVAYHSFETDHVGMTYRLLSNRNEISSNAIRNGKLTKSDIAKLKKEKNLFQELPIHLHRYPNGNRLAVSKAMRSLIRQGCHVHIIDYLQRCDPANDEEARSDKARIDSFLREIDQVRRATGCTVIMLAQLNREADGLHHSKLHLRHVADTSQAEKDADSIWFILKGLENEQDGDEQAQIKKRAFYCLKGRDTSTGQRIPLNLKGAYAKLEYVNTNYASYDT